MKSKLTSKFLKPTNRKRKAFFMVVDIIIVAFSMYLAFELRFVGPIFATFSKSLGVVILLAIAVKLPIFYKYRLYDMSWRFVSVYDLLAVLKAVTLGSIVFATALFVLKTIPVFAGFPRSIFLMDYFITLIGIGGFRSTKRILLQGFRRITFSNRARVLIIGAGNEGEKIVRDMLRIKDSAYFPVGFVDDDPTKKHTRIHGVKIYGGKDEIPKLVNNLGVEEIVIATPSVSSEEIRDLVKKARETGVKHIKVLPSLDDMISGYVRLSDIREIRVEDLLGREPVEIDTSEIEEYIFRKVVLITGAGGSVGSELSRQITKFKPKCMIILDQDETNLFYIENELREKHLESKLIPIVGNIMDESKISRVFTNFSPEVVFHAAAYKHVPMLEEHSDEAVKNNIIGTKIVAEISRNTGVDKFILISTDKAVNPTSVMGVTKRVAEMAIQTFNGKGVTKFIAVRFGNVLESRGSVIPIFKDQIKRGGPVTVTHPEMKRYFMTLPEAVLLILQAGAIGTGGEVFVLDMGEPIKIIDLAEEMIRLSGFEPDKDIPIVFTGIRPGEKLFEEILTAEEGTQATKYRKIFTAKMNLCMKEGELLQYIDKLKKLAVTGDKVEILKNLKMLVPTYKPKKVIAK